MDYHPLQIQQDEINREAETLMDIWAGRLQWFVVFIAALFIVCVALT